MFIDPRQQVLDLLERFVPFDDREKNSLQKTKSFIRSHSECFGHYYSPGHVTGSALVVDTQYRYALLNHHTKMNKWLQFGGHSDDHPSVADTALRETREESGLNKLEFSPFVQGIFDVDVHSIPPSMKMPEHIHYDIRFLLIGDKKEPLVKSYESKDLQWVKLENVVDYNPQPELLRMVHKVQLLKK